MDRRTRGVLPIVLSAIAIGMGDMLNLFLFGTTQFDPGLVFLTLGGRLVSATENALINTLETPLAVAWSRLCFGDSPSGISLLGGIIVVAAVAAHVWHGNRSVLPSAAT
jgi:drug/metabolite transporter (DMT)-like permease